MKSASVRNASVQASRLGRRGAVPPRDLEQDRGGRRVVRAVADTTSGRLFERSRSTIEPTWPYPRTTSRCTTDWTSAMPRSPRAMRRTRRDACRSGPPPRTRRDPFMTAGLLGDGMLSILFVFLGVLTAAVVYGWIEAGWLRDTGSRGAARRVAGRARRHSNRTSLRLSPRRTALTRQPRERACCEVGVRAAARPRVHYRRSRLPPTGRASTACAHCMPRPSVRRARQPRRRGHARPFLPRSGAPRSRTGKTARGRGRSRHAPWGARLGRRRRPGELSGRASAAARVADPQAALRLLLCHFPRVVERIPGSSFDLILAGHLHAGQICVPLPGRRMTLAHPRAELVSGLYRTTAGTMHVSPGTGTTFVPFRLFARPEVTELVLRRRD